MYVDTGDRSLEDAMKIASGEREVAVDIPIDRNIGGASRNIAKAPKITDFDQLTPTQSVQSTLDDSDAVTRSGKIGGEKITITNKEQNSADIYETSNKPTTLETGIAKAKKMLTRKPKQTMIPAGESKPPVSKTETAKGVYRDFTSGISRGLSGRESPLTKEDELAILGGSQFTRSSIARDEEILLQKEKRYREMIDNRDRKTENIRKEQDKVRDRQAEVNSEKEQYNKELRSLNAELYTIENETERDEAKARIKALNHKVAKLDGEKDQLEDDMRILKDEKGRSPFSVSQLQDELREDARKLAMKKQLYDEYMIKGMSKRKSSRGEGIGRAIAGASRGFENAAAVIASDAAPSRFGIPSDFFSGFKDRDMASNLNKVVGQVKVNERANDWATTRVGSQQKGYVEAMVTVRPSRHVAPFGAPGTISNSPLSATFRYDLPLRRIDISSVEAKPRFRIGLDEIKRKKMKQKIRARRSGRVVKSPTPKLRGGIMSGKKIVLKNIDDNMTISKLQSGINKMSMAGRKKKGKNFIEVGI